VPTPPEDDGRWFDMQREAITLEDCYEQGRGFRRAPVRDWSGTAAGMQGSIRNTLGPV
jgi:hypothetical protein